MSERGVKSLSSFQKKSTNKSITIAGTKPSSLNNKLLISTGIPSLDNLLGESVNGDDILTSRLKTLPNQLQSSFYHFVENARPTKNRSGSVFSSWDRPPVQYQSKTQAGEVITYCRLHVQGGPKK